MTIDTTAIETFRPGPCTLDDPTTAAEFAHYLSRKYPTTADDDDDAYEAEQKMPLFLRKAPTKRKSSRASRNKAAELQTDLSHHSQSPLPTPRQTPAKRSRRTWVGMQPALPTAPAVLSYDTKPDYLGQLDSLYGQMPMPAEPDYETVPDIVFSPDTQAAADAELAARGCPSLSTSIEPFQLTPALPPLPHVSEAMPIANNAMYEESYPVTQ